MLILACRALFWGTICAVSGATLAASAIALAVVAEWLLR
jgi:hypothetical protein